MLINRVINYNKKLIKFIGPIIFVLIFIFQVDFQKFLWVLQKINLTYFSAVIFILITGLVISPFRWHYILKQLSIRHRFSKTLKIHYLTNLFGTITPGRAGEVIGKISLLKAEGHSINDSLVSAIINRLADMFLLLLLGGLGLLTFSQFLEPEISLLTITPLLLIILFLVLIKKDFSKDILGKIFIFFVPTKFKNNWRIYCQNFIQKLANFSLGHYAFILFLTIGDWILTFIAMYLLAFSLGIKVIPLFYFVMSISLSRLVGLLPISISGLGTREATLLALFSFFAVPPENTIAFSILSFLTSSLLGLTIGLYVWIKGYN